VGREKLSGLIFAVTNFKLLSKSSGLTPWKVKRLFGKGNDRDYYEDEDLTITVVETDEIETGGQVPPKSFVSSR